MAGGPSAYFRFWNHFDDPRARARDEAPRIELLDAMTVKQRRRTELELLHRLGVDPSADGWVIVALGALGTQEAVPVLRGLLQGPVAEDAAIALWRIQRWSGAVRVLERVVDARPGREDRRPPTIARRVAAAHYLAEIGSPRARAALEAVRAEQTAPYRLQRVIARLL